MMAYTGDIRPCVVQGVRALFHGWAEMEKPHFEDGKQTGRWRAVNAVVELEDGSVKMVMPDKVHFADSGKMFMGFNWEENAK